MDVSEVRVDETGQVALLLAKGGIRVRLRRDDWDWKISCIGPVLEAEQKRHADRDISYLDFCGQRAFVGYRTATEYGGRVM